MGEKESKVRRTRTADTHATIAQAIADDYSDSATIEAGEYVPTIALSPDQAEVCDIERADDDNGENVTAAGPPHEPTATKSRLRKSLQTSAVAVPVGSFLSRGGDLGGGIDGSNSSLRQRRAEFISATLIKPSVDAELGLSFKEEEAEDSGSGFVISRINPSGGLIGASGAPFQVGDKVISVNHCSCDKMDHTQASKLLRDALVEITVVVQNRGGDPQTVETMITKPNPHHTAGIGFSCPESLLQVNVSCLLVDGLFGASLLSIGDEVVSINGIPCRQLDSSAAADIVRSAPTYVTVVAKKFMGNGMVIATGTGDDGTTKKWFGTTSDQQQRHKDDQPRWCRLLCCCNVLAARGWS